MDNLHMRLSVFFLFLPFESDIVGFWAWTYPDDDGDGGGDGDSTSDISERQR